MFCKYCGRFLSSTWRYCPHCGRRIKKGKSDPFELLFRRSLGGFSVRITSIDRKSVSEEPEEQSPAEKKSTIRLNSYDEVTVPGRTSPSTSPSHPPHSFSHRHVVEPEGKTRRKGEHTIIQVKLPGVKKEDIEIQELDESIEIKAFKDNEAYFKQIQVPQSTKILSHHLERDELIIEVG